MPHAALKVYSTGSWHSLAWDREDVDGKRLISKSAILTTQEEEEEAVDVGGVPPALQGSIDHQRKRAVDSVASQLLLRASVHWPFSLASSGEEIVETRIVMGPEAAILIATTPAKVAHPQIEEHTILREGFQEDSIIVSVQSLFVAFSELRGQTGYGTWNRELGLHGLLIIGVGATKRKEQRADG